MRDKLNTKPAKIMAMVVLFCSVPMPMQLYYYCWQSHENAYTIVFTLLYTTRRYCYRAMLMSLVGGCLVGSQGRSDGGISVYIPPKNQ